ncbi:ribosome maturation factor RimP [Spartinivicinus ruber]|uniref:ribosome maturation factor RimP n=1 Tax=Spartinivicinus ruber TaxID=2683272 RepID=UPI0013CFA743|nr:ribosome maturation factor RimP [Spartinivicinus ruber]
MSKQHDALSELIEPTIDSLGFELWGIEFFTQGKHSKLRVFIESDAGISLENCEQVSRQVSSILDVEDPIAGEYTLEVSSPGLDRRLFKLDHFQRFIGSKVSLKLRIPFEGKRKFVGRINGVEEDEVVLQVDEHEYLLPITSIEKANIVPEF